MKIILCTSDGSRHISCIADTRETALSDGSHGVDALVFYMETESEPDSEWHAPSSLRQVFPSAPYANPCCENCKLQLVIHCIRASGLAQKWCSHLQETDNVTLGDINTSSVVEELWFDNYELLLILISLWLSNQCSSSAEPSTSLFSM
jgi:hypothetical protein